MKLYCSKTGVGEKREREEVEERSESEKRSAHRYLGRQLLDAAARTAQTLAFAVGATVLACGCAGKSGNPDDAETTEIIDGDTDGNEVDDVPDIETEDISVEDVPDEEVETNCLPPGTPLEGEVDPFIANTESGTATLDSSDSEVGGDIRITVGGEVSSSDMLVLGECPGDPDAIAAFGAQDGTVDVTPQYRLDFGSAIFVFQLPSSSEEFCQPIDPDNIPVSMYNGDTNIATKNVLVGTVRTRGEVGFTAALAPSLLVNGSEAASPVILDGSGYDANAIIVSLENPLLNMAAVVYSSIQEEVLSKEVQGAVDSVDSKELRIYKLGEGESMLPGNLWNNAPVTICMRPRDDASAVTHEERVIDAVVTPQVVDACGRIFDGFDLESVTKEIEPGHFNPPHLASFYSFDITEITGLDTMADGSPAITLTVTRDPSAGVDLDMGEHVEAIITIRGRIVSRDRNPKTGQKDAVDFEMEIQFTDPDANMEYLSQCGYEPAGF